jgi:hypothetical protein
MPCRKPRIAAAAMPLTLSGMTTREGRLDPDAGLPFERPDEMGRDGGLEPLLGRSGEGDRPQDPDEQKNAPTP